MPRAGRREETERETGQRPVDWEIELAWCRRRGGVLPHGDTHEIGERRVGAGGGLSKRAAVAAAGGGAETDATALPLEGGTATAESGSRAQGLKGNPSGLLWVRQLGLQK